VKKSCKTVKFDLSQSASAKATRPLSWIPPDPLAKFRDKWLRFICLFRKEEIRWKNKSEAEFLANLLGVRLKGAWITQSPGPS
jgi:hypothetical protein